MRFGLALVAVLLIGAFGAHALLQDSGYVLIDVGGYVVEMSVPGLVIVLTGAYLAIRLAVGLWEAPRRLGGAWAERRLRRAGGQLTRGLMHIADGDWARGERLLTRGARASGAPLVNYLMAARAAQQQGESERRDEWLRIAYEELPEAEITVLLTQAELQLDGGEHERALAALRRILDKRPRHPVALALAARAARALGDSEELAALLPSLGRASLEPGELEEIAVETLRASLAGPELTSERLEHGWAGLPASLRALPRVIAARADALERLGRGDDAERELRAALKRRWAEPLIAAYGRVRSADPARQLRQAEAWLRDHPDDGTLLLTAARLCIVNELWGKARSYLESSIAIEPAPEAYALYGRLLDRLGENERAALAFRSGLALAGGTAADVPALSGPSVTPPPVAAQAAAAPSDAAPDDD